MNHNGFMLSEVLSDTAAIHNLTLSFQGEKVNLRSRIDIYALLLRMCTLYTGLLLILYLLIISMLSCNSKIPYSVVILK